MADYPSLLVPVDHVEPVPRRVRAELGGRTVLDTTSALYVWEWPPYPQFYVPVRDVAGGVLEAEGGREETSRGTVETQTLVVGRVRRPGAARRLVDAADDRLRDTVRFEWDALDRWYEEDEQVFVHPRSPYTRVDALRSSRSVRVERDGVVLAESSSPVMVFETGLPTRHYLDAGDVDFSHLVPTDTVSHCPYKGRTSGYWSVQVAGTTHADLAWTYDFPTRQLLPIAGLVAFYDEKVDVFVDGTAVPRPRTHFS